MINNTTPCKREEEEEKTMEKKIGGNQGTITDRSFIDDNSLARTPSLPSYQVEDPENEFSLSTLIRQASLTSSDVFINKRPRNPRKKAMKKSYSAPRAGGGPGNNNNNKPEEKKSIEVKQTKNKVEKKQANLRKSMSNLETQMLGLRREEVASTFEDGQTSSQVPRWPVKASSVEDMKAQIKFWARSVAANANVR